MVSEIFPAFVIQQFTVDGYKGVGLKRTLGVDGSGNLFLAGSVLSGYHNRKGTQANLINGILKITHGARDAIEAVEEMFFSFFFIEKLDSILACGEGNLRSCKIKYDVILVLIVYKAANNGKKSIINIAEHLIVV